MGGLPCFEYQGVRVQEYWSIFQNICHITRQNITSKVATPWDLSPKITRYHTFAVLRELKLRNHKNEIVFFQEQEILFFFVLPQYSFVLTHTLTWKQLHASPLPKRQPHALHTSQFPLPPPQLQALTSENTCVLAALAGCTSHSACCPLFIHSWGGLQAWYSVILQPTLSSTHSLPPPQGTLGPRAQKATVIVKHTGLIQSTGAASPRHVRRTCITSRQSASPSLNSYCCYFIKAC